MNVKSYFKKRVLTFDIFIVMLYAYFIVNGMVSFFGLIRTMLHFMLDSITFCSKWISKITRKF
ncbi:hypothetical protein LI82_07635 [Methanococcoides methylutens]|uniref:Uncharacterized protein n=1 Tax=Methanococcoides methylutens TaxID=2226 RepID=A0A099T1D4_METMT|nr:hypothetical protein LI82_07635 [Methanococcoides methylutens]